MLGRIVRLALAAVGLYFVWPSLVEVFGSYDELAAIRPWWFVVMAMFEMASFVCVWLLVGISTSSSALAADRDVTTRRQRSELDRPGRPGCWRAAAVLLHGPRWGGTGPNGIGSRGGFDC